MGCTLPQINTTTKDSDFCGHRQDLGALEPIERLRTKLFKPATEIGVPAIKAVGYESKEAFIERKLYILKSYP